VIIRGSKAIALSVFLLFIIFSVSTAHAHKVYVFAWVENGVVYTESSFGDRKVNKGTISVVDSSGTVLLTGETNENGEFSFDIPKTVTSDLTVKLFAGAGHQGEWKVSLQELKSSGTPETVEKAMKTKAELEKGPGASNILAGIAIIFGIAFAASTFYKIRQRKKNR